MTQTKHIYIAAALICVAIIGGLVLHAYLGSQRAVDKVNQIHEDNKPIIQEAANSQRKAEADESKNQSDLKAFLATIATQQRQSVQAPVDYSRIDAMIAARLGNGLTVKSEPAKDAKGNILPDAPSSVTISGPHASEIVRNADLECEATKGKFSSCQESLANETTLYNAEVKSHEADKHELAEAKTAMKGGNFWHRVKSGVHHTLCGSAGTGAGIYTGKRSNPATGAIVGAGTMLGCELILK